MPKSIPHVNHRRLPIDESLPLAAIDIDATPDADEESVRALQENNLAVTLMSVSAGMVGVCLTVIGLFRFMQDQKQVGTIADDLVAIDSILFVAVCIISYCAIRTANRKKRQRLDRLADVLFLAALSFMAVICGIISWTIA